MDPQQDMVIDLERLGSKRMFITEEISYIKRNNQGLWTVCFKSSPKVFNYNKGRLLYLSKPERIDIVDKGLYIQYKHITNVAELLRFTDGHHTFYRVTYTNGSVENLDGSEVYVTRTPIDKIGGSLWDYLRKLADETGLMADDKTNLLSKQYELVDVKRDNVPLAQFLGDKTKLRTYRLPKQVYYAFGCNTSQKKAVEAALTHQVSVIQGPPGTGKTQTILNIIANLLIAGKTVLVVSNNNSAVNNVAEKLEHEGLGFIVAKLGSVQKKEEFVADQQPLPDMSSWHIDASSSVKQWVKDALNNVSQGFSAQLRQAELRAEYDALLKEATYNEKLATNSIDCDWLYSKSSSKIMELLSYYQIRQSNQIPSVFFRIKWALKLGLPMFSFLQKDVSDVIASLENAYYIVRKAEIEKELQSVESTLQSVDIKENLRLLRAYSLQILKNEIAEHYRADTRTAFTIKNIKAKTEDLLREYPVVLSTTYSAKSCISKDMVFDYVIMDEASQVDIKTGALALSCAMNAVIVGDDKQLPNVVSQEEALALQAIQLTYKVDDRYNEVTHSFLQSCVEVFKDIPVTLLREHYRCHPKIIEFCNQHFYNGELVAMTDDNGEDNVLQVVQTVEGNHARGHFNQREIDVIVQEVLPQCADSGSVGIITPYRQQADEINKALGKDIASTVHKYQGRECDTIIMSMVDNKPTEFSDDPNLLNVAISRAKTHLYVVTNSNEMPKESNLAQLIDYVRYNNFEVRQSEVSSVFDLLYKQYTSQRLDSLANKPVVSDYISENLFYNTLMEAITALGLVHIDVLCHYPVVRFISDWSLLTEEEKAFASNRLSHVDFLVYNSLTKRPLLVIEVDGWYYHKRQGGQVTRDALKDKLLAKFGLPLHRILTTDTVNVESLKALLSSSLMG
ncbi:AAA domain-containing protein [Prevotella histicola]